MKVRSFRPNVGRVQNKNYTDKERADFEAKKVLYNELCEIYHLDTFCSKFTTKSYLDELKAGMLWAP